MTSGKKSIKFTWNQLKNVDGYKIYMSECNSSDKKIQPKKVVTIKNGSDIIAATKDISATSEFYMAVPLDASPTTFSNLTIEATTAAGIYTYVAPSAVNLSHSTYYQSTVKMTNTSPRAKCCSARSTLLS